MVVIIEQKQLRLPISIVITSTYMQGSCMITIDKIPGKLQSFFEPVKAHIAQRAWEHFWALIMAITICQVGSSVSEAYRVGSRGNSKCRIAGKVSRYSFV